MKSRRQKPHWVRKIADERILQLMELAEKAANKSIEPREDRLQGSRGGSPLLAKRYVTLALELSKKYNARMPKAMKAKFCKKCHAFFTADNCTTKKARKANIMIKTCKGCKYANKRNIKTSSVDRKRRA